jgi:riboflavin synthase
VDDSISVNGCCLTVEKISDDKFEAVAIEETLKKTTLGFFRERDRINLERAVKVSERLGGHLVQGHVDGVGEISNIIPLETSTLYQIKIPDDLIRYVIKIGSIALDGISLTVADLADPLVTVAIIPHTIQITTIHSKKIGDKMNVEVDLVAKYIEKMLFQNDRDSKINEEWLKKLGY